MYFAGNKKTTVINAFKRTAVIKPRDLYARYGERMSTNGISSTDASTVADIIPSSSSVIEQMIAGQKSLEKHVPKSSE